jgi:hypothetical protein
MIITPKTNLNGGRGSRRAVFPGDSPRGLLSKVRDLCSIIFLVLLCASSTFAEEKYKDLVAKLRPGITNREAEVMIYKFNQKYRWNWKGGSGDGRATSRHQMDDETYIKLYFDSVKDKFGNLSDDDRLSSIKVFSLDDLKTEIPTEAFESIRYIHKSPSPAPRGSDPIRLIQAVNHLHTLGKSEVLNRLRLYHDLTTKDYKRAFDYDLDEQRIFLIVRLLFATEDQNVEMPVIRIGATYPIVSGNHKDWPLFPLTLRDDIPFFIATGYTLAGLAESPLRHLEFAKAKCQLRPNALKPSNHPMKSCEELLASSEWNKLFSSQDTKTNVHTLDARLRYEIRVQASRCLPPDPLIPVNFDDECKTFHPYCAGDEVAEKSWLELETKLLPKSVKWNSKLQAFEMTKDSAQEP